PGDEKRIWLVRQAGGKAGGADLTDDDLWGVVPLEAKASGYRFRREGGFSRLKPAEECSGRRMFADNKRLYG
ncbi:MAG TPA: hypothetical protein VHO69_13550, partial [Phototrophicaceae bacterium]|nr:hypothetical protein [Phototrophicaceae bacterium]